MDHILSVKSNFKKMCFKSTFKRLQGFRKFYVLRQLVPQFWAIIDDVIILIDGKWSLLSNFRFFE